MLCASLNKTSSSFLQWCIVKEKEKVFVRFVTIHVFFPLNYLLLTDLYFELSSLSCWVVVFLYGGFLVVI